MSRGQQKPTEGLAQHAGTGHTRLVAAVVVTIVTLAVFLPATRFGFLHLDDDKNIWKNPHFQPATWSSALDVWRAPYRGLYIPVTYSAWHGLAYVSQQRAAVDADRLEFDPKLFHGAVVLLHLLNSLLVLAILRRLLCVRFPRDQEAPVIWAAGLGAALFAVYPGQVESVAWASGLKDTLYGMLALACLHQYIGYVQHVSTDTRTSAAPAGASPWFHYGLASAFYVLALLAKPMAVAVPLIVVTLEVGWFRRPLRRCVTMLPWVLLAAPIALIAKSQQPDVGLRFVTPIWARPLIVTDSLAFYLHKVCVPFQFGLDYGRTPSSVLEGAAFLSWIVPCGLVVLLWFTPHRRVWLSAVGIFVAALLPVSGMIPFTFQNMSTVADRYMYLAMLGPALAFASVLAHQSARRVVFGAGCLLVALLAWRCAWQVTRWQDDVTMLSHAVTVNPHSSLMHNNLGNALYREGRPAEAVTHLEEAIALRPDYVSAHYNLGKIHAGQGRFSKAAEHLRAALQSNPNDAEAHNNLGWVLARLAAPDEAMAHFHTALELQPDAARPHKNLADLLLELGQFEQAAHHYRTALRIQPNYDEARLQLQRAQERQAALER